MSVVPLADVKAYLNIPTADSDAKLQTFIDAAEAVIANAVGPLAAQPERTDRVDGGYRLVLPIAPVISVTSVTPSDGSVTDLTAISKNLPAGILYFTDATTGFWSASYDVTYVPGRSSVPGDLLLAIKEQVRHLWTTQRGPVSPANAPSDQQAAGYLMPYRVQELIEPYRLVSIGAA